MPPQQTTPRPAHSRDSFYNNCATYPELPKFRRFAAQWTKKLYDDGEALMAKEEELNRQASKLGRRASGAPTTHLDYPRKMGKKNSSLSKDWKDYNDMLRAYSEDLCLFHRICQLPPHAPFFAHRLAEYKSLFHNSRFGPTNEPTTDYLDPYARDFVACKGMDNADYITTLLINNLPWLERHIIRRVRPLFRGKKPLKGSAKPKDVQYPALLELLDWLTCAFVPFIFTATVFALAHTTVLNYRIGIVWILGTFFALLIKLVSLRLSRGEIFAYTAAFFAVASVFVSTNDCVCTDAS